MKPPVDVVKVSARAKETMIRVRRRTGLEHWNEICRLALCRSLATASPPQPCKAQGDVAIEIEWKTFAGQLSNELSVLVLFSAARSGVDLRSRDAVAEFFRSHLERGIASLYNLKTLSEMTDA